MKQATDFQYVRGHAILHDELGVYSEDAQGKPKYNFTYIDQIYDGIAGERSSAGGRDQLHAETARV